MGPFPLKMQHSLLHVLLGHAHLVYIIYFAGILLPMVMPSLHDCLRKLCLVNFAGKGASGRDCVLDLDGAENNVCTSCCQGLCLPSLHVFHDCDLLVNLVLYACCPGIDVCERCQVR